MSEERDIIERALGLALIELAAAQKEEQEASDAYAGDDLTEDWHRAALARLMRAEDEVARRRAQWEAARV